MTKEQTNRSTNFNTILILSAAVWLVVMNTTMFNIALPTILEDFSLAPSEGAWIVSGYSIVLAIFTITYTRLSDYLPLRMLLIIGMIIFGSSSLLGFFADSFTWLLIARLCQASGAAAIPGLSFVFASRYIPVSYRGRAMAIIASASALGFGLGPVAGGIITQFLSWNYLFIITLFVVAVIPILKKKMPEETVEKGAFDILGGLLTGGTITSFLLFITTYHWYYPVIGLLLAVLLWMRITRAQLPFIQPELLQNKLYRRLLYITYIGFATNFAILFLMPLMLQQIYNLGPLLIGMVIFPGAILSAGAAIIVGKLIDKFGNIIVLVSAQGLLLLSSMILYFLFAVNFYMIMFAYLFTSFGFSSLSSSSTNEVSRILPDEQIGAGIGLKQLTHFIGSASGAVLAGILLEVTQATGAASFLLPLLVLIIGMSYSYTIAYVYIKKKPKERP
ncbi:MFS transporter, DHA2 family, metal-tetracycline-proton antiporter [Thalassobacillus cyri]|uniref:MFS transporter, DHA2 family, metal-tetracycline-proton antiporter n=1 Tax=Thalassobacillus cyri TaxID=571932 RepID=A0A1H3Y562_9BACI|nr:MFS transporter [Thalassobacillus cyri]SEA05978.1 MFS transporter, DHA2 family, metal-tetracycline-proton antiporter [Thalassobacillus cyri]